MPETSGDLKRGKLEMGVPETQGNLKLGGSRINEELLIGEQ